MDAKEWVKLQESLLVEQLKVVRRFLKKGEEAKGTRKEKGMSKINVVMDILDASPTPLHVTEIIKKAKEDGLNVTCEATPHHFSLTDDAIKTHLAMAKINPPLRT